MYNINQLKKLHLLSETEKEQWKNWLIHEADLNQKINFNSQLKNRTESLILILLKHIQLKKLGLNQEEIYHLIQKANINEPKQPDTLICYILQKNKSENLQLNSKQIYDLLQKTDFQITNFNNVGAFYYLLKNNESSQLNLSNEQIQEFFEKITEQEKDAMLILFCEIFQKEKNPTETKIKRLDLLLNHIKMDINASVYLKLKEKNQVFILEQVEKFKLMKKLNSELNQEDKKVRKNKI
jgi:hypothetical protein